MNISLDVIITSLFIIGFIYILVKQLQSTLSIQKNKKLSTSKRVLIGSYLTTFSIAGFLISFLLNISLSMELFQSTIATGNNTAIACILFVIVALISKYGITPTDQPLIGIK